MPTRPDAPDLAVDELQRRARRRLVGAVVLALAAAVILPFLLESEPKPLGDEVSVRIPPVDGGKFVNPLTPRKAADAGAPAADPKAEPRPGAVLTPKKSIVDAERRVMGQGVAQPAPVANAPSAAAAPAAAPPAAEKGPAQPPPKPAAEQPASTSASPPRADTHAPGSEGAAASASAPAAAAGGYAVQVGAFADAKVAGELAAALSAGGFATYTEAVPTAQGPVQRVRVGPFSTRAAADAAVVKLKAAGHDRAMVINAK